MLFCDINLSHKAFVINFCLFTAHTYYRYTEMKLVFAFLVVYLAAAVSAARFFGGFRGGLPVFDGGNNNKYINNIYVYIYIYIYVCIYMYIYMYIYIFYVYISFG